MRVNLAKEYDLLKRVLLAKTAIALLVDAIDWEDAIRQAGQVLVNNENVESSYVEAMLNNIHNLGPYIFIAPNVAMPHARPEDGVNKEGISVVTLLEAIEFGSDQPFKIVICLAAVDQNLHIDILQKISEVIADEALVETLLTTDSIDDVYNNLIGRRLRMKIFSMRYGVWFIYDVENDA